jgi:acetoin utilization deacetylase AcuC-like enzyme
MVVEEFQYFQISKGENIIFELEQVADSNILIVTAMGRVTDDDYEDVLIPAMESTLENYDKVRILIQLGEDFDSIEGDAVWEDTKVGMKHFTSFEKCAIVSDKKWIIRSIKVFGFLVPGEVKLFANNQLAVARDWIAE